MVDEDEVKGPVREAVLALEGRDGRATVAERADDDRDPLPHPGVVEDAARDRGVVGVELDGVQVRPLRHGPRGAQGAVAAVRAQLEQAARPDAPERRVEQDALLVAHVDHEALAIGELVHHPDGVVDVARLRVGGHVGRERRLPAVSDPPLLRHRLHVQQHAHERPAQQRHARSTDLREATHAGDAPTQATGAVKLFQPASVDAERRSGLPSEDRSACPPRWRRWESNPRPRPRAADFYERSPHSDLVPCSPCGRGCGGPALWRCPRFGEGGPPRVSRHVDPGTTPRPTGGGRDL